MEYTLQAAAEALPDSNGKITLKDGHFEQAYPGAASGVVVDEISEAQGDLNGDGRRDAAVVLAVSTGGSGVFEYLVAVLDQAGSALQSGTALLGDRVKINSLAIQDGKIAVDMLTQGPNDPLCCPTQKTTASYLLKDGELTPAGQ